MAYPVAVDPQGIAHTSRDALDIASPHGTPECQRGAIEPSRIGYAPPEASASASVPFQTLLSVRSTHWPAYPSEPETVPVKPRYLRPNDPASAAKG